MSMRLRLICLLAISLLATACNFSLPDDGTPGPEAYKTVITEALENDKDVFWLGDQIEVAGQPWEKLEGEHPTGVARFLFDGIQLSYFSVTDYSGRLDIWTIPAADWVGIEKKVIEPIQATYLTRRDVSLGGRDALLVDAGNEARAVNGHSLILHVGNNVILASTTSLVAKEGAEANPLMDEATFPRRARTTAPVPGVTAPPGVYSTRCPCAYA